MKRRRSVGSYIERVLKKLPPDTAFIKFRIGVNGSGKVDENSIHYLLITIEEQKTE